MLLNTLPALFMWLVISLLVIRKITILENKNWFMVEGMDSYAFIRFFSEKYWKFNLLFILVLLSQVWLFMVVFAFANLNFLFIGTTNLSLSSNRSIKLALGDTGIHLACFYVVWLVN